MKFRMSLGDALNVKYPSKILVGKVGVFDMGNQTPVHVRLLSSQTGSVSIMHARGKNKQT